MTALMSALLPSSMPCRKGTPSRRPSILDRPSFKVPHGDAIREPSYLTSRPTNPGRNATEKFLLQPYRTEILLPAKHADSLSPSTNGSKRSIYTARTSQGRSTTHESSSSKQSVGIPVNYHRDEITDPEHDPKPPQSQKQNRLTRHHFSPLPPSKIRALKSAYEKSNPDGVSYDHSKQIRLSRAVKFHEEMQKDLEAMTVTRESTFANTEEQDRDHALASNESKQNGRMQDTISSALNTQQEMLNKSSMAVAGRIPTLVRAGPNPSSPISILIRWTSPTGQEPDTYTLHYPFDPLPRAIRYQLFEEWGTPFGAEGRDWEVDEEGRVWVRERPHKWNRRGRWWVLWGTGEGV